MTDTRPPAPYPADTRSKGWRFEIDTEQIVQSDTWDLAAEIPMAQHVLLMMWTTSWAQLPCGSMPADPAIIRAKLKVPQALWETMAEVILRGWYQADDGRLYHPTITKRVIAMLDQKTAERTRKAEWRAKVKAERESAGKSQDTPNPSLNVPEMSHGTHSGHDADGHGKDDTGTGTGTGTSIESIGDDDVYRGASSSSGPDQTQADKGRKPPAPVDPITTRAIELAVMLRQRGASLTGSNPDVLTMAREGFSDGEALGALEIAQQQRTDKASTQPINAGLLLAIARDRRTAGQAAPRRPQRPTRPASATNHGGCDAVEPA